LPKESSIPELGARSTFDLRSRASRFLLIVLHVIPWPEATLSPTPATKAQSEVSALHLATTTYAAVDAMHHLGVPSAPAVYSSLVLLL
jgi:hypothetical protein